MTQDIAALETKALQSKNAVGKDIDLSFLPKELISICNGVVKAHHERNGYRDLMKIITEKEPMVCILVHNDLRNLLGGILASRKLNIACFVACGVALLAAMIWSGWIALAIIPGMFFAYHLGKQYRSSGVLIAALLLTLEMVNEDSIELSRYLPNVWQMAHETVERSFPNNKTRFLDTYIPLRSGLDNTELGKMIKERIVGTDRVAALSVSA